MAPDATEFLAVVVLGVNHSMSKSGSVSVRVRCVVDIPVGTWGRDCVLGELSEQARKEGANKIRQMIAKEGGKLHSEPQVVFVMVEEAEE